ncbi:MAG: hypothetical protein ACQETH_09695 [Candidatus Rifleibacteriota bacterium]
MFQPNHRGIYEYLWSEHKYLAISVSIKAFQGTAGKLGKVPQCTTLLGRIANHGRSEKPELLNALLSAYMHLKPLLTRQQRESVVKKLLTDIKEGSQQVFDLACEFNETSIWGCRLFYPFGKAVYKFWDVQELPGLWLCFGPFQLHIAPAKVAERICNRCELRPEQLKANFKALRTGVSSDEYQSWPANLRKELENNNFAATPGKRVSLNPRFNIDDLPGKITPQGNIDFEHVSAMILEEVWDTIAPETIGRLPELTDFKKGWKNLKDSMHVKSEFSLAESYEWLSKAFNEQKQKEAGR